MAEVLVEHGYARPGPLDMVALLAALHGFLYLRGADEGLDPVAACPPSVPKGVRAGRVFQVVAVPVPAQRQTNRLSGPTRHSSALMNRGGHTRSEHAEER